MIRKSLQPATSAFRPSSLGTASARQRKSGPAWCELQRSLRHSSRSRPSRSASCSSKCCPRMAPPSTTRRVIPAAAHHTHHAHAHAHAPPHLALAGAHARAVRRRAVDPRDWPEGGRTHGAWPRQLQGGRADGRLRRPPRQGERTGPLRVRHPLALRRARPQLGFGPAREAAQAARRAAVKRVRVGRQGRGTRACVGAGRRA